MHNLTISLQALVASSVFFVWVIRYANIVQEFKQYGLPDWLRDLCEIGVLLPLAILSYAVFSRQWAERTGRKLFWSLIITTCRCEFLDGLMV